LKANSEPQNITLNLRLELPNLYVSPLLLVRILTSFLKYRIICSIQILYTEEKLDELVNYLNALEEDPKYTTFRCLTYALRNEKLPGFFNYVRIIVARCESDPASC